MNLSQYIFYSSFYLIFWSKANPSPLDDLTINLNILDNGHQPNGAVNQYDYIDDNYSDFDKDSAFNDVFNSIIEQEIPGQLQPPPGQSQLTPGQLQLSTGQPQLPQGQPQLPQGQQQLPPGQPPSESPSEQGILGQPQPPPGQSQLIPGQLQLSTGQPQLPQGQPQLPQGQPQLPAGQPPPGGGFGFFTGITFGSLPVNGGAGLSLDGCIREDNVAYWGEAIIGMITSYGEEQCAVQCSRNEICQFWVVQKSNNLCLLKTHQLDKRSNNMYISGSKGCGAGGNPGNGRNTATNVLESGDEVVNRGDASNRGEPDNGSEANNGGDVINGGGNPGNGRNTATNVLESGDEVVNRGDASNRGEPDNGSEANNGGDVINEGECLDGVCGASCNRVLGSGPGICNGKGSCVHPLENPCAQHGCKGKLCEEICLSGDITGLCDGNGSCEFDFEKAKSSCEVRK